MTNKKYEQKKSEEYMSDEMQAHFKQSLEIQCESLLVAIKVNNQIATQKNDAADQIDQASIEAEKDLGIVKRERSIQQLRDAKKAINKFKEGDFGYCDACGEEIGVNRLNINASLPYCVECADIKEKTKRLYS